MNPILKTIRNFAILSVLMIVGTYVVVLMQINGTLPSSELSENVINEVVSKMELK